MEFKTVINDGNGQHEVALDMSIYRSALSPKAEIDNRFPVLAGTPLASDQILANHGFYRNTDSRRGIVAPRISALRDDGLSVNAAVGTAPGSNGISRFLAPMAVLSSIEDAIYEDRSGAMSQFMQLVGQSETITGLRAERPVFNYNPARDSRARPVAQGSEPTAIGLLGLGEKSYTLPTYSYGLEVTDQAAEYLGTEHLNRCVRIMVTADLAARIDGWLLSMVNGDSDYDMAALATEKANTFDSSITVANKITQKAYMKWINKYARTTPITHLVMDFDTAMLLEQREGRPVVTGDNATSPRIDTTEFISNPSWPGRLPVVIVNDPNWPAGLILGLHKPDAILYFQSVSANYSAAEQYIMRRTSKLRVDYGGLAIRHYDMAFHALSLTV